MPSSPLIKSVWCHCPFSPTIPGNPRAVLPDDGWWEQNRMGPTHRSGHGHVGFSLFTTKIRRLLQVCGQSHRAVKENQLFLWPQGSWPVPGLGSRLRITQVTGPQHCSTCSSLIEIQKISISTSSKQKPDGVNVTGLQPGATSCGHPWMSQTRACHSQSPQMSPTHHPHHPLEMGEGKQISLQGCHQGVGEAKGLKKPRGFCLVPLKRWDQLGKPG